MAPVLGEKEAVDLARRLVQDQHIVLIQSVTDVGAKVANGEFALRFLSPGRYAVTVRRIGYRPVELTRRVSASDTTVTVRMSPVPGTT